jgi:hypothetical protein
MTKSQIFECERQRRARQRAMSIDGFCKAYGIGRTKAYEEINAGRLKARKAGKRTIITEDDAEEWLSLLPAFQEGLNEPSPETCAAAEVQRRNESAQSLQPIQKPLPRDPTATADVRSRMSASARATAREDEISSRRSKKTARSLPGAERSLSKEDSYAPRLTIRRNRLSRRPP